MVPTVNAQVGESAPRFDLEGDSGARMTLDDFSGKWLVLYFYPRDNTPGCTREAQDFTAAIPRLRSVGAVVAGISRDSVKTHCSFRDKIGIRFPLLSDPDLVAHRAYGAWGMKTMYGKKVEGTIRSTFLISPEGRLAQAWTGVKVDGHADKVLAAIAAAKEGDGDDEGPPVKKGDTATRGQRLPAGRTSKAGAKKPAKGRRPAQSRTVKRSAKDSAAAKPKRKPARA